MGDAFAYGRLLAGAAASLLEKLKRLGANTSIREKFCKEYFRDTPVILGAEIMTEGFAQVNLRVSITLATGSHNSRGEFEIRTLRRGQSRGFPYLAQKILCTFNLSGPYRTECEPYRTITHMTVYKQSRSHEKPRTCSVAPAHKVRTGNCTCTNQKEANAR